MVEPRVFEYAFDVKLQACIRVQATSLADAYALAVQALDMADVSDGAICGFNSESDGNVTLTEFSLTGEDPAHYETVALESTDDHLVPFAELPTERLRDICENYLESGEIWRPSVVAESQSSPPEDPRVLWYWHDKEDDSPSYTGPFYTEREALLDAIKTEGVDEDALSND